jgi:hypothetical protein
MLIVTVGVNREPVERLFGYIGCEQIAPVADYRLVATLVAGKELVTTLPGYSRWTEPAYALLARLIGLRLHAPPDTGLGGSHLRSTIYLGRDFCTARPIERLDGRIEGGYLLASIKGEVDSGVIRERVRSHYAHPLELLEHAARLAVWLADAEPPVPPPLTAVPVHDDGGLPYVLAEDIPAFPRRAFERRRLGCTVPMAGAYYAHDWWSFIGGRP